MTTPITATTVPLVWNRLTDPSSNPSAGSTVFYVSVAGGPEQSVLLQGTGTLSTILPGLTSWTPYRFQIAGMNSEGAGGSTLVVGASGTSPFGTVQRHVRCGIAGTTAVRGDLRYCRATVGANGSVTVTTFGYPGVVVTMTLQTVPRPGQIGYRPSAVWARTWTTSG